MGRARRGTTSGGGIFLFCGFTGILFSIGPPGGVIFLSYVFTGRVRQLATSGGPIFRCTTKDRGERRASSSQAPHPSFCLSGQKLSRSAAPPLPTKPTSLGFGGAPVGGPLESPGVNSDRKPDVLCANHFATVHLTRLSRLRRCRLSPCLCVLRVPSKIGRLTQPPNFRL